MMQFDVNGLELAEGELLYFWYFFPRFQAQIALFAEALASEMTEIMLTAVILSVKENFWSKTSQRQGNQLLEKVIATTIQSV